MRYTIEECVPLLTGYLHYVADYAEIVGDFQHCFPNQPVPTRQIIHRLNKKFQETGSLVDLKCAIEDECDVLQKQPEFFRKSWFTVQNHCIDENGFQYEHKM